MEESNNIQEEEDEQHAPPDNNDDSSNQAQNVMWYPRRVVRSTNFLHRMDALCRGDVEHLRNMINFISESMLTFGILMTHRIYLRQQLSRIEDQEGRLYSVVSQASTEVLRRARISLQFAICIFEGYLSLAYYPSTNRIGISVQSFFGPERYLTVESLGTSAHFITGFTTEHLSLLLLHLRIPERFVRSERAFSGEMAFIRYLCWFRKGMTKVDLAATYFGGDPRRFTQYFDALNDHLYEMFYHKISGDSLRMWKPQIDTFRQAIWQRLTQPPSVREVSLDQELGRNPMGYTLQVPLESGRFILTCGITNARIAINVDNIY